MYYHDDAHANIDILIVDHTIYFLHIKNNPSFHEILFLQELNITYSNVRALNNMRPRFLTLRLNSCEHRINLRDIPSSSTHLRFIYYDRLNLKLIGSFAGSIYIYSHDDKYAHYDYPFYLHHANAHEFEHIFQASTQGRIIVNEECESTEYNFKDAHRQRRQRKLKR